MTKEPLQKFNSKEDRAKERETERERQAKSYVPVLLGADRHLRSLIRLSLQYPSLSFDDPSHHLFLFLLSVSFSHTHTPHIPISNLCFSLSSPQLPFSNNFFISLPPCSASSSPSPPLKCVSSCFESYSLISTSAFVTLVQFHIQVVTVGRLGFG